MEKIITSDGLQIAYKDKGSGKIILCLPDLNFTNILNLSHIPFLNQPECLDQFHQRRA